ncbi:MAG: histidine kinase [Spirochaetia bacterium]|nr:histidine kinase [Spirochaetia bacterium]
MKNSIAILSLLAAPFLLAGCFRSGFQSLPHVQNGILDLTNYSINDRGKIRLDGEWEFCFGQFLEPGGVNSHQCAPMFAQFPGYWKDRVSAESGPEGSGYATYRVIVKLHAQDLNRTLALYVPHAFTAYKLFINGRLAAQNGTPGKTAETTREQFLPLMVTFLSNAPVEILIHVSNFTSTKGGFRQSIELGGEQGILQYKQILLTQDSFLIGSMLVIGLYHLTLFFLRRSESYAIYFALCAFMFVIYRMTTGEYFLVILFPQVKWILMVKAFLLSVYLSPPFFLLFVQRLYPAESITWVVRAFQGAFGLLVVSLGFINSAFEDTLVLAEILILLVTVYLTYVFFLAAIHKRDGARGFIAGFIVFFATIVNDILFERDVIQTEVFAPMGLLALMLSHSFVLFRRFTRVIETVENQQIELSKSAALREQMYRISIQSRRMELEMLKKTIQPHFLINSLAAIRAWLIESPEKSAKLLDDFAGEMRIIQRIAGQREIALSEEIALCEFHLRLMEARREKKYSFYVRGLNGKERIPPMIFHTMIENAFTHLDKEDGNLSFFLIKSNPPSQKGEITTRYLFIAQNPAMKTGPVKPGSGMGLRYIKTRLEESYPGMWSTSQEKSRKRHAFEILIKELAS